MVEEKTALRFSSFVAVGVVVAVVAAAVACEVVVDAAASSGSDFATGGATGVAVVLGCSDSVGGIGASEVVAMSSKTKAMAAVARHLQQSPPL